MPSNRPIPSCHLDQQMDRHHLSTSSMTLTVNGKPWHSNPVSSSMTMQTQKSLLTTFSAGPSCLKRHCCAWNVSFICQAYRLSLSLKKSRIFSKRFEFVGIDVCPDGNRPAMSKHQLLVRQGYGTVVLILLCHRSVLGFKLCRRYHTVD